MEASLAGERLRTAQAAQHRAFEQFYRRYAQHVYRYTLAVLRNPADAEDVTQTTFMNAYRAMQGGLRPRRPHHWLIKIAHNACRSRYASRRRRVAEVPLEEAVDHLAVPAEEKPNVQAVLRALGRLPFNQRAALVMRELEGRSYKEIAETLDVSVPAVEMLIFRARKSLRVHARSLRALGTVQLPGTLTSFFEGAGGVAAAGGVLGAGVVVKVVAALAAATAVAGAAGNSIVVDAEKSLQLRSPTTVLPTTAVTQSGTPAVAEPTGRRGSAKPAAGRVATRRASAPLSGARSADPKGGPAGESSPRISSTSAPAASTGSAGASGNEPVNTVSSVLPVSETPNTPVALPEIPTPELPPVQTPTVPLEPPPLPPPPKLP